MKKLFIIFAVAFAGCSEKEPTCISCVDANGYVWSGCIEEHGAESTQELIEAIAPLLGTRDCREY